MLDVLRKPKIKVYIAEWREERGVTQEQLADLTNTTKGTISKLEHDKQRVTMEWLDKISVALKISPFLLLTSPKRKNLYDLLDRVPPSRNDIAGRMLEALIDDK